MHLITQKSSSQISQNADVLYVIVTDYQKMSYNFELVLAGQGATMFFTIVYI